MKNLFQIFTILFAVCCVNVFANEPNRYSVVKKSDIIKKLADDQGPIQKRTYRVLTSCDCGLLITERGFDLRGQPYIKQFFKAKGTFVLRLLALDPDIATHIERTFTCEEICNGLVPSA